MGVLSWAVWVWVGVMVISVGGNIQAAAITKANSTHNITVPSDLLLQLLELSRQIQHLLPKTDALNLLDAAAQSHVGREEGASDAPYLESPLLSLALKYHTVLQQRNEDLLAQNGRCTAQVEALQEDKEELRQQIQEYKKRLRGLQLARLNGRDDLRHFVPAKTDDCHCGKPEQSEATQCTCSEVTTELVTVTEAVTEATEPPASTILTTETTPAMTILTTEATRTTIPVLGTGLRVKDCASHQNEGANQSGIYDIFPSECRAKRVWCDLETEGGGWTVFLKRQEQNNQVNFSRTWREYEDGFGDTSGEYWLGLKALNQLTAKEPHILRVEGEDFEGTKRWGEWRRFRVGNSQVKYKLLAVMYSTNSTLGDGLLWHSGMQFSTIDNDNDKHKGSCAHEYKGGWWYNVCHNANPTGILVESPEFDSMGWVYWKPRKYKWASLKYLHMKIRPQGFGAIVPSSAPGDCTTTEQTTDIIDEEE